MGARVAPDKDERSRVERRVRVRRAAARADAYRAAMGRARTVPQLVAAAADYARSAAAAVELTETETAAIQAHARGLADVAALAFQRAADEAGTRTDRQRRR